MSKRVFAIYSTGADDVGLDTMENDMKGIYIYVNSISDIESIENGDIILFLQTQRNTVFLLKYDEDKMQVFVNGDRSFARLIVPSKTLEEGKNTKIPVAMFKNFYFIGFDALTPWVRAPFGSRKNLLVLDSNKEEILESFTNEKELLKALQNPEEFTRKYIINNQEENHDDRNVYLEYDSIAGKFGKEFSVFGSHRVAISDRTIDACLSLTNHKKNQKILIRLKESGEEYLEMYSEYYDLTRVMDFEKELNKMDEGIEEINNQLEKLKYASSPFALEQTKILKASLKETTTEKNILKDDLLLNHKISIETKNNDVDNNLKLKAFYAVIVFMGVEVVGIFIIFILTGLLILHFNEWNLNLFIGATISQITATFHWIIKHLFPERK